MFPIDYQVNVRRGEGPVRRYTLLENQGDKYLIVVHPSVVSEMSAHVKRENPFDDALVAFLVDEAMVLDRKKGTVLPMEKATKVLAESEHAALRRAAVFRQPLPEWRQELDGDDLALAFSLEMAKRRTTAVN